MRANPAFVRGIAGNAFSCLCIASQNLGAKFVSVCAYGCSLSAWECNLSPGLLLACGAVGVSVPPCSCSCSMPVQDEL